VTDRIRCCWIYRVDEEECIDNDERRDPGMLENITTQSAGQTLCFPSLGEGLLAIFLVLSLLNVRVNKTLLPVFTLTFGVNGDGGLVSHVARDGAVSPALISPPSPLDFRLGRTLISWPFTPDRGFNCSNAESCGNGSVARVIVAKRYQSR
jgi:hypothetical protein